MEGFHTAQPLLRCRHHASTSVIILSSRHMAMKQWEGPAAVFSSPSISALLWCSETSFKLPTSDAPQNILLPPSRQQRQTGGVPQSLGSLLEILLSPANPRAPGWALQLSQPPFLPHGRQVGTSENRTGQVGTGQCLNEFWNKALHPPTKSYSFKYSGFFVFLSTVLWSSSVQLLQHGAALRCGGSPPPSSEQFGFTAAFRKPYALHRVVQMVCCYCGAFQNSQPIEPNLLFHCMRSWWIAKERKYSPQCSSSSPCSRVLGILRTARARLSGGFVMDQQVCTYLCRIVLYIIFPLQLVALECCFLCLSFLQLFEYRQCNTWERYYKRL